MGKGSTKTLYGRKTPAEVRAAIQDICESNNYDPFEQLIKLATETLETEIDGHVVRIPIASIDQKIAIAKEVASYIAPKIKNIEVKQEIDAEITFKILTVGSVQAEPPNPEIEKRRQGVKMLGLIPSRITPEEALEEVLAVEEVKDIDA